MRRFLSLIAARYHLSARLLRRLLFHTCSACFLAWISILLHRSIFPALLSAAQVDLGWSAVALGSFVHFAFVLFVFLMPFGFAGSYGSGLGFLLPCPRWWCCLPLQVLFCTRLCVASIVSRLHRSYSILLIMSVVTSPHWLQVLMGLG